MQSDQPNVPDNGNPGGDTGNTATFRDEDWTIGSPYWRTVVGKWSISGSAYDTFDQGGNLWEWNEAVLGGGRCTRGAGFDSSHTYMLPTERYGNDPTLNAGLHTFRVALVPEPATLIVVGGGLLLLLKARRRPGRKPR